MIRCPYKGLVPYDESDAAFFFGREAETEVIAANLRDRLEVRKLLDRAKGQLQDGRGMTEAQAFRWIQKASMDRRQTMRSVAEEILADAEKAADEKAVTDGGPQPGASSREDPATGKPDAAG